MATRYRSHTPLRTLALTLAAFALASCSESTDTAGTEPSPDTAAAADTTADVELPPEDIESPEDVSDIAQDDIVDTGSEDIEAPDTVEVDGGPDVGFVIPEHEFGEGVERPRLEKPLASGELRAGVAVVWSDGPVGVSMAGYGGRDGLKTPWSDVLKGSRGFYGRSNVKALVMEVDGERLAFIKSPFMCGESYLTYATIRVLKEKYDIDMDGRVLSSAGHSHHNTARYWPLPPELGAVGADSFDPEVAERIGALFAEAIKLAIDDLGPAEWAFQALDDWDPNDEVYRDRRGENNPTYGKDPRVSLVGVRRPDGTPMALMMNFPIHGTVFGPGNDLLTEDAPGYVERKVEEHFFATYGKPVFGMHMQSAGGDASPAGDSLGHPKLARLERIGEFAARPIVSAWATLEWRTTADLGVRSRLLEMRHDRLYEGTDLADEFTGAYGPYQWGGWQCSGDDVEDGESMEGAEKQCVDVAALLQLFGIDIPHPEVHQVYLSVAQLSEVVFLTLPGEPTWSLVKYARDEIATRTYDGKPTVGVVFGYSQDHYLYLTAPDDWFAGGYESEMSLWGPAGGRWMVDRNLELVDDLIDGYAAPVYYEETPYLSPVPEYDPRAQEISLTAGELHEAPAGSYARGETVTIQFGGGDPGIGSPNVVLERKIGEAFEPVPSPNGWASHSYGNRHYGFITVFTPTPEMNDEILDTRDHDWTVHWQVPAELPLGTYRLHISGVARTGESAVGPYELTTEEFTVGAAPESALVAEVVENGLAVAVTMPGASQQGSGVGSWPVGRYRLIDPMVSHGEVQRVSTPLVVTIRQGESVLVDGVTAGWDPELRAALITWEDSVTGELTVEANLPGDDANGAAFTTTITLPEVP